MFDKNQITLLDYPCGLDGSYTVPSGVAAIASQSFSGCSGLSEVTICSAVTNIADGAFQGCADLTAISVATNNIDYSSLEGVLFDKAQTALDVYPGGLGGNYTVPSSVTSISDDAFAACPTLTT